MDEAENNPSELDVSELAEAARRAGSIVNEQIDTIVQAAERQADEIRRAAERDAEATRREAVKSASRVFEQIAALERPLADLVGSLRLEAGAVQREIEGGVDAEAVSIPVEAESLAEDRSDPAEAPEAAGPAPAEVAEPAREPAEEELPPRAPPAPVVEEEPAGPVAEPAPSSAEPAPEPVVDDEEEPASEKKPEPPMPAPWRRKDAADRDDRGNGERPSKPEPEESPSPARETPPSEPRDPVPAAAAAEPPTAAKEPRMHEPPPFTVSEPDSGKGKGLFSRLRPGGSKRPFIDTPGHCAVCQKTFEAGDEETLRQSGWRVNDDVGLCPEDQADGWQLPAGARLPFRRGGG